MSREESTGGVHRGSSFRDYYDEMLLALGMAGVVVTIFGYSGEVLVGLALGGLYARARW